MNLLNDLIPIIRRLAPLIVAVKGLLARPTLEEILRYRRFIDKQMQTLLFELPNESKLADLIHLGIHHEQQHQELILMDIKHNYFTDPMFPVYSKEIHEIKLNQTKPLCFLNLEGGIIQIGALDKNFSFDNERPRHRQYIPPYSLANRLITNGEYLEFMNDNGYQRPELWLSDGWDMVQEQKLNAPLYWIYLDNEWYIFTLQGLKPINIHEPVCHISYYEADAYANWCKMRLPTEAEWEHAVNQYSKNVSGNFLENNSYHPYPSQDNHFQFFGDLWEWTSSPYIPYPGYKRRMDPLGEYNGKFMSNQFVLRGGACITPKDHIRTSYRNFYAPNKRWQFSGIRLAKDEE